VPDLIVTAMNITLAPERTLSELDHVRLSALARRSAGAHAPLEAVLEAATTLPPREVPPDVVTMHSRICLADASDGARSEITLVYPQEADPAAGRVSVLSPVGAALIGQQVGAVARWSTPGGQDHAAEILSLSFQPEASGDYTS
jgi:regulator of nucleoside diphosphate kinase